MQQPGFSLRLLLCKETFTINRLCWPCHPSFCPLYLTTFILMGLNFIKRLTQIRNSLNALSKKVDDDKGIKVQQFYHDHLFTNPKYQSPKRLGRYEYQVFSQNGEDGIIQEIFNRIGY